MNETVELISVEFPGEQTEIDAHILTMDNKNLCIPCRHTWYTQKSAHGSALVPQQAGILACWLQVFEWP